MEWIHPSTPLPDERHQTMAGTTSPAAAAQGQQRQQQAQQQKSGWLDLQLDRDAETQNIDEVNRMR